MSKHKSRKQRWAQESTKAYKSDTGRVFYDRNGWYASLDYQTLAPQRTPHDLAEWEPRTARLGPFKRPRDAMVAVEREETFLRNRHGTHIRFADELWGQPSRQT
jgi:hypothetical protein